MFSYWPHDEQQTWLTSISFSFSAALLLFISISICFLATQTNNDAVSWQDTKTLQSGGYLWLNVTEFFPEIWLSKSAREWSVQQGFVQGHTYNTYNQLHRSRPNKTEMYYSTLARQTNSTKRDNCVRFREREVCHYDDDLPGVCEFGLQCVVLCHLGPVSLPHINQLLLHVHPLPL